MQGAINIKGMGAPNPYDEKAMSTELTCFKGFTPKTFNELVQTHVQGGYPIGEKGTEVENPFNSVLNYGADGTCALVMAVSYMLNEKGKTIEEVRVLDESNYKEIQKYIRYEMSFDSWTEADLDPPPPEAYFPWDVIKVLARVLPIGVPCFLAYLNSIPGFDTFVARSLGKQTSTVV